MPPRKKMLSIICWLLSTLGLNLKPAVFYRNIGQPSTSRRMNSEPIESKQQIEATLSDLKQRVEDLRGYL